MTRMTTQERLDCLLKHIDSLAARQGDEVVLNENDESLLIKQCGFADRHEIAFYVEALQERQLVTFKIVGNLKQVIRITINGYCHLDTLDDSGARS